MSRSPRCQAFTISGDRCKLNSREGNLYCHIHSESHSAAAKFVDQNREVIIGFFAGLVTETFLSDGYDYLKSILLNNQNSQNTDAQYIIDEINYWNKKSNKMFIDDSKMDKPSFKFPYKSLLPEYYFINPTNIELGIIRVDGVYYFDNRYKNERNVRIIGSKITSSELRKCLFDPPAIGTIPFGEIFMDYSEKLPIIRVAENNIIYQRHHHVTSRSYNFIVDGDKLREEKNGFISRKLD